MMHVQDISPFLRLRISARARRFLLRLDSKERCVWLIVPKRASQRLAYDFAVNNRAWIEEKLRTLPPIVPLAHQSIIPILGRDVRIVVTKPEGRATSINLEDDVLTVATHLEDPSKRIARFLKDLAGREFRAIADAKAAIIGKKIRAIQMKDMKSRWGSCSRDGDITLNWRLIFSPYLTYDYVIAHEVAHLKHAHHRVSFWNLCKELSVGFDEGSHWIKLNATELTRFN